MEEEEEGGGGGWMVEHCSMSSALSSLQQRGRAYRLNSFIHRSEIQSMPNTFNVIVDDDDDEIDN